jgi:hypothetical protein
MVIFFPFQANEEKCAAFPVYNREWERYQVNPIQANPFS